MLEIEASCPECKRSIKVSARGLAGQRTIAGLVQYFLDLHGTGSNCKFTK